VDHYCQRVSRSRKPPTVKVTASSSFREIVMRAPLWDENAQQAERAASNQSRGIEPLLLTLIDEIRGLRQDLRETSRSVNAR
jgi:hypothetical protein